MHDWRGSVSFQVHIFVCHSKDYLGDGANLQMQTHFVPKIMHHIFALILQQLHCRKISLQYWSQVWQ